MGQSLKYPTGGKDLETVIIALGAGVVIGYFNLVPQRVSHWTNYLTLSGLIILLLSMGMKVGSNPKILGNLGNLGIQAFILAFFSIVFSVIFIIFLDKYFINLGNDKQEEVGGKR